MFSGKFFKGNNMLQLRLHNGRYYAHAQVLNAYNFCFKLKFNQSYKNVYWTVFTGQQNGTIKNS